jgi:hypothetical protein
VSRHQEELSRTITLPAASSKAADAATRKSKHKSVARLAKTQSVIAVALAFGLIMFIAELICGLHVQA